MNRSSLLVLFAAMLWSQFGGCEGIGSPCISAGLIPDVTAEGEPLGRLVVLEWAQPVDSETTTLEIAAVIQHWLETELGLEIRNPVELHLCSKLPGTLAEGNGSESPTWGSLDAGDGGGLLRIRSGLPAHRLVAVIGHELVHAWQAENAPADQRIDIHEGFAQWGAGELLKALGLEDDFKVLATREDLYGEAYRFLAAMEDREGREALLRYVRTTR